MNDAAPAAPPQPANRAGSSAWAPMTLFLAAAFLAFVAAAAPDALLSVDRPIADAVRGDRFAVVVNFLTRAGSQRLGIAIAVAAALSLWKARPALALAWPCLVSSAIVVDLSMKLLVDRPRPPEPLVGTALGSFPSGHVLMSVAVFGLLPPTLDALSRSVLLFWASAVAAVTAILVVAYSRVYLGAHWPTDVVASILIGSGLLLVACRSVARAERRRSSPSRPGKRSVGSGAFPGPHFVDTGTDALDLPSKSGGP